LADHPNKDINKLAERIFSTYLNKDKEEENDDDDDDK
jgi:hypothetical protein